MPCGLLVLGLALAGCSGAESGAGAESPAAAQSTLVVATTAPSPTGAAPVFEPRPDLITAEEPAGGPAAPTLVPRAGESTLVQLTDPLDEPEFYCIDVPGFGTSLNLRTALNAHTCKPGADDELFAPGQPLPGNLSMPAYGLCLQAAAAAPESGLELQECSHSPLQRFATAADGSLRIADSNLCLAVAPGAGEPTGGPSHLRRALAIQDCATVDAELARWQFPGPSPA